MSTLNARPTILLLATVLVVVPLYAHHGSQFLSKAMEMNTAEVRLAEMAVNKAQNPRVKDYAQMLIRDHNEALDKIRELRDARLADSVSGKTDTSVNDRNLKNAAEVQLTPEHQRVSDRLSALSGTDFDRQFIDTMVRDHREAIRVFEAQTHVHGAGLTSSKQTGSATTQTATREKPTDQKRYSHADLTRDVDTVDFANASMPTLKHHLEEAEQIQKQVANR